MNLPALQQLLDIMARLRNPQGGCPWDLEQNFQTIVPHTIEEAYEVAEAIAQNDMQALKEELGDLLLQVVFHAQMASEQGLFDFSDIAASINEKLIRRHPHLFGHATIETAEQQVVAWEAIKAEERVAKRKDTSLLADVPLALPAATRAVKLQKRAAGAGFDWPDTAQVFEKILEELEEVKEATEKYPSQIEEEMGDVLFACINLARHLKIDPESAMRRVNAKFEKRFRYIEASLAAAGKNLSDVDITEMDRLWNEAKKEPAA